jgi:hypothetical protein
LTSCATERISAFPRAAGFSSAMCLRSAAGR